MTTPDEQGTDLHDTLDPADAAQLGPDNPNVAANRDTDEPVDHEQLIGEPVDDDPVLDAERAAVEAGQADEPATGPDEAGR